MREILFRGKRIDNGEWANGYFVRNYLTKDDWCIADFGNTQKSIYGAVQVIPETIGQFTGRNDKNGKKIFEDDIIVICYETDGEEFTETKRVHYNEKECCWYPMRWEECCEYCDHYTEVKSIEIIGNIHDNPELLEAKE